MAEIMASLDDIQANLDENVSEVTDENTALLQISVARIIRGNLASYLDNNVLQSWRTPDATPEIIREAAAKLIAAQHYFNHISKSTDIIDPNSFSQKRYDEAMAIINGIIGGTTIIPNVVIVVDNQMSVLDFFPTDATDRAFTLGRPF